MCVCGSPDGLITGGGSGSDQGGKGGGGGRDMGERDVRNYDLGSNKVD